MSALPNWIDDALKRHGVRVERYGRTGRGRPTRLERRWFFCGWYYHRASQGHVIDGPHGPFPCVSAAMTDALAHYKLAETTK